MNKRLEILKEFIFIPEDDVNIDRYTRSPLCGWKKMRTFENQIEKGRLTKELNDLGVPTSPTSLLTSVASKAAQPNKLLGFIPRQPAGFETPAGNELRIELTDALNKAKGESKTIEAEEKRCYDAPNRKMTDIDHASNVQAIFRKKVYLPRVAAATKLQSGWRGRSARTQLAALKEDESSERKAERESYKGKYSVVRKAQKAATTLQALPSPRDGSPRSVVPEASWSEA